eukprot:maker-scaffold146_size311726-snap-gene-2.24 protein:Tk07059 transcript:maker-scaffold146_size311726-snap-gene-2.24-mRNA-1 annotation:"transcription factor castor"
MVKPEDQSRNRSPPISFPSLMSQCSSGATTPVISSSSSGAPVGMLSAALLGASSSSQPSGNLNFNLSGHPPTPPRTPKTPSSISHPDLSSLLPNSQHRFLHEAKLSQGHALNANSPGFASSLIANLSTLQEHALSQSQAGQIMSAAQNRPSMLFPGVVPTGLPMALQSHLRGANVIPSHMLGAPRVGMIPGVSKSPTDYTRYFKRFGSSLECGSLYCKDMSYREHFHCTVPMCKGKVFAKKEEMIRHSKWHQKMEEALKYGFRRVTPMDDCSDKFPNCQHNKKQTHYHCIHTDSCDKVYISTSDVQMHFNYHRKDNAIQREGFLRFRGVEDCGTSYCTFRSQKTTHFHCNRTGCNFTFKNKADMEKHKNYHMKDEQLNKDGFKKFMKQEPCGFTGCRFSGTVNHIHCIRSNCDYVLHSSGQLYSHKRKHERKDNELAYQKYKKAQSMSLADHLSSLGGGEPSLIPDRPPSNDNASLTSDTSSSTPPLAKHHMAFDLSSDIKHLQSMNALNNVASMASPFGYRPNPLHNSIFMSEVGRDKVSLKVYCSFRPLAGPQAEADCNQIVFIVPHTSRLVAFRHTTPAVSDDIWRNYMLHFDSGEGCGFQGCELEDVEHFHCKDDGCETVFKKHDGVQEHGKNHFLQDQVTDMFFKKSDPEEPELSECQELCPHKNGRLHYHCKWENCSEIIFGGDVAFKRLDHYKLHEYTKKWNMSGREPVTMTMSTSIDAMFKRKRGRPPKNRVVEVWNDHVHQSGFDGSNLGDFASSPQAVFTSFKLPKPGAGQGGMEMSHLHPFGLGNFPGNVKANAVMNAPLGGLPAMASQIAHAQQFKSVETSKASEMRPGKTPSPQRSHSSSPLAFDAKSYAGHAEDLTSDDADKNAEMTTPKSQGLIKARGTYYPLTAFPTNMPQGSVMRKDDASSPNNNAGSSSSDEVSPTVSLKSKLGMNFVVSYARQGDSEEALAKLLQARHALAHDEQKPNVQKHVSLETHAVYGPEPEKDSCGRPFCKLKRKAHYHCNICNQGFTEQERLENHLKRHTLEGNEFPSQHHASPSPDIGAILREELAANDSTCESGKKSSPSPIAFGHPNANNQRQPDNGGNSTRASQDDHNDNSLGHEEEHNRTSSSPPASGAHSPGPMKSDMDSIKSSPSPLPSFLGGLPPSFASLLGPSLGNIPTSRSAQTGLLLPPCLPHFFPQGMMLPGMPNLFQQAPRIPSPTFDPSKHPLTRMPEASCLKRSSPLTRILEGLEDSEQSKKMRLSPSMRMMKDEPVPEGYMRFRFNEDCGFTSCNYREHQTHFHCMRKDCNYRFCDKTRFVQHTARHERLDTLSVSLPGEAQKSSSHFHCLKCDYHCTDTNKVVAHRRQHQKLDSIMAAGFEKYTPTQYCPIAGCSHNSKQTHYHCSKCQYAVLGLSQMEAHKFRHMNE